MSTDQETIGIRIAELRAKSGTSGNALAKAAGISQPYLWQIEQGIKDPPISTLRRIANALGVTLSEIIPT